MIPDDWNSQPIDPLSPEALRVDISDQLAREMQTHADRLCGVIGKIDSHPASHVIADIISDLYETSDWLDRRRERIAREQSTRHLHETPADMRAVITKLDAIGNAIADLAGSDNPFHDKPF